MPLKLFKELTTYSVKKKWFSRCDDHESDHVLKAPRAIWAQLAECIGFFQYTPRIYLKTNQQTRN